MSSMWAPDNAKELQNARSTPRKTPFADQHAKARDQGFLAPDSAGGGNGRRSKSNAGRNRGPGSMDDFPRDRRGGRPSGRGRSRAPPFPQHPPPSPMQQGTSSRGYRRKSSREREAVYRSIWGDSSEDEKEKEKAKEKETQAKEETGEKDVKEESTVDTQEVTKGLDQVKITPSPPPAPPATVIPPPAVISGADWSELTDDEDLAFLEDVPVPVTAPASVHEDDSADERSEPSRGPNSTYGLEVTTADDIDHSVRRGAPRVNVGRQALDKAAVDVKLANQLPVEPVIREQVQTSSDIGSEGESTTSAGDRSVVPAPTNTSVTADDGHSAAVSLQSSRWASAPRGMGNRGARGGRPPNGFQNGHVQHNKSQQMPPQHRHQPPHTFARPPHFNRPPPIGPRANNMLGQDSARPNLNSANVQAPRGNGSRNAPPVQHRGAQPPVPSPATESASESTGSSPLPLSTPSATSVDDSAPLGEPQNRGPRQAAVPKDTVKRLMRGWIGTGPGGMRRGTSGRGRGRGPVKDGEGGSIPAQEEAK
ncbi:hypothetical protein NliqN6_6583 [Naganishia liquefaciens]|uniref:Uncharacterized protein n=1 Tax=Naganishia liquefaciens TaxID=104408 RepID=A0A8H3TYV8_9TREE|nr:hypothetical protein NliqN6_6583 [Naganishia liquefaciens]